MSILVQAVDFINDCSACPNLLDWGNFIPVEQLRKSIDELTPQEASIARHVLTGASIVDSLWLHIDSHETIDQFLKINGFDWSSKTDQDRLQSIHSESLGYVESFLQRPLHGTLRKPKDLREIFLVAADDKDSEPMSFEEFPPASDLAVTTQACLLLKVMNIIQHIDGHELLYACHASRRELAQRVDDKIGRELSRLKGSGFPIVFFEGSRKPKESLITKLLCKRGTIASRINDRLRYQIITKEKSDIVSLLVKLFGTVLPFNYLLPGATTNKLLDPSLLMTSPELVSHKARDMAHAIARSVSHLLPHSREEMDFTGESYQNLKFVVDVPVQLSPQSTRLDEALTQDLGKIVYSLVEITMVDEATHKTNQQGDNAHDLYKKRQKAGAMERMTGGKFEK